MKIAERVEWWFRHSVTYPALKRVFRNLPHEGFIDLRSLRSILILRYDRYGDMVVTSPFTRQLRALNPELHIGIAASSSNAALARYLPGVDQVHVVSGRTTDVVGSIVKGRRRRYDLVMNCIFNRTSTGGILANIIAPSAVKVGQGVDKYAFYFNKLIRLSRGSAHMVGILDTYFASVFGSSWGVPDLRYELRTDPDSEKRVDQSVKEYAGRSRMSPDECIVLNTTAGEERRNPTPEQVMAVARHLCENTRKLIIMVGSPSSYGMIRAIRRQIASDRLVEYPTSGSAPFMDMVSLLKRASLLISPDTSLVHVSAATRTPVVALYSSLRDFAEWSPVGIHYEAVIEGVSGRVSTIQPSEIIHAVHRLMERKGQRSIQ